MASLSSSGFGTNTDASASLSSSSEDNGKPRTPSKKAHTVLSQANSVYDLPSTEQAIKWMHAI